MIFYFHNMIKTSLLFGIILSSLNIIQCKSTLKIPDYIVRCKKNDPHLDQCISKSFESVRSRLDRGIPELGMPPADPLYVPEIDLFNGEKGGIKAKASEINITGLKDFKLQFIRVNLETLEFNSSVYIPSVHVEGIYDVNSKFSGFKVKGKGPFKGNATDITIDSFIKGNLVTIRRIRYLELVFAQVHISFKKYHVKLNNLFKDKELNEAFNQVINDPNVVPVETIKPILNDFISRMLVETWNKMSKSISFDEIFV